MIPDLLQSVTPANVQNVQPLSKKAPPPIIGLQMENSIAYPAENPSTGNSFQQLPMKMFIRAMGIHMPVNFWSYFHPARLTRAFLCSLQTLQDCKLCNLCNSCKLQTILSDSYAIQRNASNKTS